MRLGLHAARSRLTRLRSRHSRESPYYTRLTPCEDGGYYRDGAGPSADLDVAVIVNTTGGALFETTVGFLDAGWPIYVIDGSHRCYGLPAIVHAIEKVDRRWAVMLDEDAFVVSNERLVALIDWARQSGYAAVGVPDGGVIPRRDHNPNALNLFFNVLDLEAIRGAWDPDACRSWMNRGSEMTDLWPPAPLMKRDVPYVFDDYEPYYCFYFWLVAAGLTIGYLDARIHSDSLSAIVLDHTREPVVVHSWYAREFDTPGPMRDRILDVIEYARGGEDRGARWRGRM